MTLPILSGVSLLPWQQHQVHTHTQLLCVGIKGCQEEEEGEEVEEEGEGGGGEGKEGGGGGGRGGKGFFFMRTFFCEDICWGDVKNWKIVSLLKGLWIIINCPFKHTSRT